MKTNQEPRLPLPLPVSRLIMFASSVLALGALSSCHTTAGLGRDMEHAGRAIEGTAQEAHSEMHR